MAGYFNTGEGGSPNAAADFARLNAEDPSQFSGRGLFDKLFRKPAPAAAQAPTGAAPQSVTPAITSAPSLVARVLKASQPQQMPPTGPHVPLAPGPGPMPPEMNLGPLPPHPGPSSLPPFRGIPQFGPTGRFGAFNPPPPGQFPPPPPADMMPPLPQRPPPVAPRSWWDDIAAPLPGRGGASLPQMPAGARPSFLERIFGSRGYLSGGPVAMMRGGYPAHLMMGLPQRFARGGPDYVRPDGRGDGRSDHVEARLSPGEFVQDAETTALLGNGDNEAGARGWEAIRQEIRKDKGKALAQGKFSPNAKTPAQYAKTGIRAARGRSK